MDRHEAPASGDEVFHRWTMRVQILAAIIVYAATVADRLGSATPASPLAFTIAVVVLAVGAWLQRHARADLGRYWSLHIEIRPDYRLVTSGLYRSLRLPTYLGWFLVFFALPLGLGSRWGLVAWMLATVPAVVLCWRLEESILLETLGESYEHYRARTRAFWPCLDWPGLSQRATRGEDARAGCGRRRDGA